MNYKLASIALVGVLACTLCAGEEKAGSVTDPVEILNKADAATKEVSAVSYTTTVKPTGGATTRQPTIEGKVRFTGWNQQGPMQFLYELTVTAAGEKASKTYTIGSDGDEFYLVDHQTKTAYVDIDPNVVGSQRMVAGFTPMLEFVHPSPFSDEINGKSQVLEGMEDIAGEPCYKILVEYQQGGQKARWYFSTKDLLPRRVERIFTQAEQSFGRDKIVRNLKVEKSMNTDMFKLELPEGYTRTDDFAP